MQKQAFLHEEWGQIFNLDKLTSWSLSSSSSFFNLGSLSSFISSLIKVLDAAMPPIERLRAGYVEMTHELRQVSSGRRYQQMEMVCHAHIGKDGNIVNG
jgi:hypothetical protein